MRRLISYDSYSITKSNYYCLIEIDYDYFNLIRNPDTNEELFNRCQQISGRDKMFYCIFFDIISDFQYYDSHQTIIYSINIKKFNYLRQFSKNSIKSQQGQQNNELSDLQSSLGKFSFCYYLDEIFQGFEFTSNMNLGKPLTAELIFTKTKSDSLHNIKNLNLWGNDLQDLSLIEKMPSLEVVSLSVNRISSLKYFINCAKLQELYLRKNNIADIRQIRHLIKLPALRVLWLHDNPCSQIDGYRIIVIKYLPNLIKLDNYPVTPEEKIAAQNLQFSLQGGDDNYRTEPQQQHQQSYSQQYRNQNTEQKWQRPSTAQSNSSQKHSQPPPSLYYQQRQYKEEDKSNRKNMQRKSNQISHSYSNQKQKEQIGTNSEQDMNRNQNILMAILSLMRQLDSGSLEIVRRQADRMLQ